MATVKPFKAIRPHGELASQIAALPYDVYTRESAKKAVAGRPLSFLNIDRPETQFAPGFDMYSDEAYETAKKLLEFEVAAGSFIQDEKPCYYIYELTMDGRAQTGLVGCASIDNYNHGIVKKHENTLAEKELDRIRHIRTIGAQTGPIFLAYRDNADANAVIGKIKSTAPIYDFTSEDGIGHRVWIIDDDNDISNLEKIFASIDALYIADGHHRAASACKVGSTDGGFMAVIFPKSQLKIMAYNRAVKDLNGLTKEEFLKKVSEVCEVKEFGTCACMQELKCSCNADAAGTDSKKLDAAPLRKAAGMVNMYLDGKWYELTFAEADKECGDPVKSLDVSLLQDKILEPILGIADPRTNPRVKFIGGILGDKELIRLVDDEDYAVSFSMYPTQMDELLSVADAGLLMPPKSTWFEPKLRSGLFIHRID